MPREGDQYLVVLSLHVYSIERLTEVAPGLTSVLERLSTEPIEPAFHSVPRDIIAYLVRSKLNAHQILAAVESPQQGLTGFSEITQPGFLSNDDSLLVIELGDDKAASRGLSRALTWLQRH